jgi:endonuclease/exonuclease/phosphatase family metal-dependent hydrolase
VRGHFRRRRLRVSVVALLPILGCAQVESESPPVPAVAEGHFRVATWNIRFFPEPSTDVDRTGEILGSLDADVVAVQEIADPAALSALLERLNADLARRALDSGSAAPRHYRFELAESGGHGGQYVGYIYDEKAVLLSGVETLTSLQMTPDLRPGLFARVKSRRGGVDFQIVVMHTDSGTKDRDYQNRLRFLDSLQVELPGRLHEDGDVIVLGDLNTMGRLPEDGLPRVRAEQEIANLDETAGDMGLRRLTNSPSCTEYYRGRGSFLDHILVTSAMAEAPSESVARVFGYCAEAECQPIDQDHMPYDYLFVSDHCPVVIDLIDADRD